MKRLSAAPGAFLRPSPSGGVLGGEDRLTRETLLVREAAGFDVVIVETVKVGPSETAVASTVDFILVLMPAGAGDERQGIKKRVPELADAVAHRGRTQGASFRPSSGQPPVQHDRIIGAAGRSVTHRGYGDTPFLLDKDVSV